MKKTKKLIIMGILLFSIISCSILINLFSYCVIRVGTYNILHGEMVDHDMRLLAEEIVELELDVVGLQEVDMNTKRSDYKNTVQELANACGFEYYYFAPTFAYQGGEYGIAIISKYPIIYSNSESLIHSSSSENRVVAYTKIKVKGYEIDFYNTHLSYESTKIRNQQLEELKDYMSLGENAILTGDFNVESSKEFALFGDYNIVNDGKMVTFPSKNQKYDDIITDLNWFATEYGVVANKNKSDHNLLWVELRQVK